MSTPESPSVLLRRAASLMRERAEKATPGPWRAHEDHGDWYVSSVEWGQVTTGINEDPAVTDHVLIERDKADAEHVAGMDPLVALAVADLLDRAAKEAGEGSRSRDQIIDALTRTGPLQRLTERAETRLEHEHP